MNAQGQKTFWINRYPSLTFCVLVQLSSQRARVGIVWARVQIQLNPKLFSKGYSANLLLHRNKMDLLIFKISKIYSNLTRFRSKFMSHYMSGNWVISHTSPGLTCFFFLFFPPCCMPLPLPWQIHFYASRCCRLGLASTL